MESDPTLFFDELERLESDADAALRRLASVRAAAESARKRGVAFVRRAELLSRKLERAFDQGGDVDDGVDVEPRSGLSAI